MLGVAGYGAVLGVLIVAADTHLAALQREAAGRLIVPRIRQGERVWLAGQWGFYWYGEEAGAVPLGRNGPRQTLAT